MAKVNRWTNAATHNLPLHQKLRKQKGLTRGLPGFNSTYIERTNLWILAAGILDATRYLNLSLMHINTDLHDEFDGNWRERSEYFELRDHLAANYADLHKWFRTTYSESTDNFADAEGIKTILHALVFDRPEYAKVDSPFALLFAAVTESLRTTQAAA